MKEKRIEILDSFRFLAIIGVIFFHYTYRWTIPYNDRNLYPFGSFYGNLFQYGNKGVQFFFIISGFVISYTLENTQQLAAFFKNRFIRLFPPMLFWSVITWLTCVLLDNNEIFPPSHQVKNFLPSLTFTTPGLWALLFPKSALDWLNGSYWTLWVEVQFYVIAGLLFFINKGKFFRNILLLTVVMAASTYLLTHFSQDQYKDRLSSSTSAILNALRQVTTIFNITYYICFFTLGVIFHHLYKRKPVGLFSLTGICIAFIFLYQLYASVTNPLRLLFLLMVTLFLLMIYKRSLLFFLDVPIFRRIGVISYSIYLAHEQIGVLLINKYGGYLGKWSPLSVVIALVLVVVLADIGYRFVEQKAGRFLKSLLFKSTIKNPIIV